MREIEFRGKRKDTGEWVYEALIPDSIATTLTYEDGRLDEVAYYAALEYLESVVDHERDAFMVREHGEVTGIMEVKE